MSYVLTSGKMYGTNMHEFVSECITQGAEWVIMGLRPEVKGVLPKIISTYIQEQCVHGLPFRTKIAGNFV